MTADHTPTGPTPDHTNLPSVDSTSGAAVSPTHTTLRDTGDAQERQTTHEPPGRETGARIRAPWSPGQVAALNRYQRESGMHPFTCGNEHPAHDAVSLVAHPGGWRCPVTGCDWAQDWAHAFMADPDAWPTSPADGADGREAGAQPPRQGTDTGEAGDGSVIHACPGLDDGGIMSCCRRPPFEVRGERLTRDPKLVTCGRAADPVRPDRWHRCDTACADNPMCQCGCDDYAPGTRCRDCGREVSPSPAAVSAASGYCPHCGRGDVAPTGEQLAQAQREAEQARAVLAEVLAAFRVVPWPLTDRPMEHRATVTPADYDRWQAALDGGPAEGAQS